jgi:hypothetical protein
VVSTGQQDYGVIREAICAAGLCVRGGFHCTSGDAVPGAGAESSLVLVGSTGTTGFDAFLASVEYANGGDDPLDRFSQRVIDGLASCLGGRALYPHQGPPWMPFQRWAVRAEGVCHSPIGVLIHPRHGLWHAYRGALLFPYRVAGIPGPETAPSPCATCADRPCLAACPVGAFSDRGYDVAACSGYLATPAGGRCLESGCQARLACPVAPDLRYSRQRSAFHMAAFARNHPTPGG